ncbi:hypothetical protein DERP_013783 [Dermatophagoides pteronyssinus]|uniref:Uncharacterized protein n=1 Tax=Dermatophagoides pteronyssinus TaxID=6956 RepID=A0ABQ8JFG9_DERPT|nr:hypothetical protein DERP_013783 [Dermatophagoides pteronyssinus]
MMIIRIQGSKVVGDDVQLCFRIDQSINQLLIFTLTIKPLRSGRSLGFFFKQESTKSLNSRLNTLNERVPTNELAIESVNCRLTPKSQIFISPREFTNIFDGLTSKRIIFLAIIVCVGRCNTLLTTPPLPEPNACISIKSSALTRSPTLRLDNINVSNRIRC